jgi:hypothetical protein
LKQRLVGALLLRPATYECLKGDTSAWVPSVSVVFATALAHGLGAVLRAPSQGYAEPPLFTFLFGFMGELLLWLGTSASVLLGARLLLPRRVTFGEVARPLGFATIPGMAVVVAGAVSGHAQIVLLLLVIMGAWRVAASYVAVRESLAVTAGKAAAYLALGLLGGICLMGAGTAVLNRVGSM